ncbi:hypothetical protein NHF53_22775 [Ciceribacter sp. RN22]|nr:hypothetical protein [Ciceribacter sp. RN22]
MYFRFVENSSSFCYSTQSITLPKHSTVSLDTFFNGFTVATWKRDCRIAHLAFSLLGTGQIRLRFGLHLSSGGDRWLSEQDLTLTADVPARVELPFWNSLDDGMLYVCVTAIDDSALTGGYFYTVTEPVMDVRLGIVVTHFNRKQYVLPAIQRITDELLDDPCFSGKVDLVVIDNSKNISPAEAGRATVIPNRNLGGSGGFMRGLLHLKDHGYTHCLFMDDDATCEIESIRRSYALMQFAGTGRFAIAGSLMRELEPYRLFEKGAVFNGTCQPLKSGLDMRKVPDLIEAERRDRMPNYGAWWFFAFSIADVRSYAFPFFVRGDDIMFGMRNEFHIVTQNGIGCWGEDFGLKSGPLPVYLDVRSHLVQRMVNTERGALSSAKLAIRFFRSALLSYNYGTARAVTSALSDVRAGPKFWHDNLDLVAVRQRISAYAAGEKMEAIEIPKEVVVKSQREGIGRRIVRLVTANGFLLPSFMIRNAIVLDDKKFVGDLRKIFRYRRVLYISPSRETGYIAVFDRGRFFYEIILFTTELLKLVLSYAELKHRYRETLPSMTDARFWRNVYHP